MHNHADITRAVLLGPSGRTDAGRLSPRQVRIRPRCPGLMNEWLYHQFLISHEVGEATLVGLHIADHLRRC